MIFQAFRVSVAKETSPKPPQISFGPQRPPEASKRSPRGHFLTFPPQNDQSVQKYQKIYEISSFFEVFEKKGSKWAATPRWTGAILELSDRSGESDSSDQSGAVVIAPDRYYGSSSSQTPSNYIPKASPDYFWLTRGPQRPPRGHFLTFTPQNDQSGQKY